MKAFLYHGNSKKSWEETAKPNIINSTDASVKILKTAIDVNDLHNLYNEDSSILEGRIMGHEGVGVIEEVGSDVSSFKSGDYVLISSVTSCGKCKYCEEKMYSHCLNGGMILGKTIDGTQAEFVRIPYADNSLYHLPENADAEAFVMLSNALPTGYECGVLMGKVKKGESVAIIGAGPIGMAALLTARLFEPSKIIMIDFNDNRLRDAQNLGASHIINISHEYAVEKVMNYTDKKGVDVVIEAVGTARTFELCGSIVAVGGHIANVGMHGKGVSLHLESLFSRNITITTHLVDTSSIPMLIKYVNENKIDPSCLISHVFKLDQIVEAYDVLENAEHEKVLKIILTK
jgi:alcohol dehydrogenase